MSKYLLLSEVPTYCEFFDDITETTIGFAEDLIDSYLNDTLEEKTFTESVKLNRKGKGKLSHTGVTEILDAIGNYQTSQGMKPSTIDVNNIEFTQSGYIEMVNAVPQLNIYSFCNLQLHSLKLCYKYGFSEIPKTVKRATAMICQNISEKKTFGNLRGYTTIDVQMTLFDDSVFTKDIRMLLDSVIR